MSCTFTMNHKNMMDVFHEVKKFDQKIITIAGGVHVSNATEIVLKEGKNINFASTYESEVSFVDFINFINNKNDDLSQLAFVKNDKFYEIKRKIQTENTLILFLILEI